MFLRTVKAAGGKGVQHEYVRLVEAYREEGTTKQRVVCNLGRKDPPRQPPRCADQVASWRAAVGRRGAHGTRAGYRGLGLGPDVGGAHAVAGAGAGHSARRAGWTQPRRRRGAGGARRGARGESTVRADERTRPGAVVGADFVCDRQGRRWMPAWRDDAERRASRRPRVRVTFRQLKQWYRTLDQLHARQPAIEQALYLRLRDLFSLKVDLVFSLGAGQRPSRPTLSSAL
jgi:hypothetical protein